MGSLIKSLGSIIESLGSLTKSLGCLSTKPLGSFSQKALVSHVSKGRSHGVSIWWSHRVWVTVSTIMEESVIEVTMGDLVSPKMTKGVTKKPWGVSKPWMGKVGKMGFVEEW